MNKQRSKNTELMGEAIGYFIFSHADKSVDALENNKDFGKAAVGFNKLPKLKRLFDFYIINFWLASVACELHYEHNDFQKICEGAEDALCNSLQSYELTNQLHGFALKDFVKDPEELTAFCKEYPVGAETRVGFRALLNILLPRRFSHYQSTLPASMSHADVEHALLRRSRYFCQHVFGKDLWEDYDMLMLRTIFTLILTSTDLQLSDYIIKIEQQIDDQNTLTKSAE